MITGQVHRFLRCPGTFNRHRWLGKQCLALAGALHQLPGIGRKIEAVVGRYAIATQGVTQARNGIPVQRQAWCDNQDAIAQVLAIFQHDLLLLRQESGRCRLIPFRRWKHDLFHWAYRLFALEHAAAHQCPARLIVVLGAGLNDGDIQIRLTLEQAATDRLTGCAAADDQYIVAPGGNPDGFFCRLMAGGQLLDTRPLRTEIVAGRRSCIQNRVRIKMRCFGQSPECAAAGAGAAEGQYRSLESIHQVTKVFNIRIGNLARDDRLIMPVKAMTLGGFADLLHVRLILALFVRAVADNRLEALGGCNTDIGGGYLWADTEKRR